MKLSELIPVHELQALCDSFTALTGAVTAVLDLEGNIFVATGWQDVCTKFHRANGKTALRCQESDTALAGQLKSGERYNVYKCKNGLVDVAVPIIIGGEHLGNFFTGQFFFEQPDIKFFIHQADEFGFDRDDYLTALAKAPIFSEEKVKAMMEFFTRLAKLIGDMGLAQMNREKTYSELAKSKYLLQTIIDTAPIRVFWKDQDLHYLGCNPAFSTDAGKVSPDEVVGKDDFQMLWSDHAEKYRLDDLEVIDTGQAKLSYDEPLTASDGSIAWIRTSKVPLKDPNDKIIGVLGIYEDITEQKKSENQIKELAFYDPLTGLPNRRLLKDRLSHALAVCSRNQRQGALLFIDLDNFKVVNDTRGHDRGDMLLKEVADRFAACIRGMDSVARIGGDEFVVLLSDLSAVTEEAVAQARLVGEKLLTCIGEPYLISDEEYLCTPSIGMTLFDERASGIDELMRQADIAMYKAKSSGRNTLRFYDPELQAIIKERAKLEADLRDSLNRKHFLLYYQPQVVEGGRVVGAEALIRWQHPQRGMVSPMEFIPLAEETGLILPLGDWVLETACVQLARWAQKVSLADLTMAVNVSAHQFRQSDFVDKVLDILERTRANPHRLKLELTESLLIENMEDIIVKMTALREKGIRFSLDDFGTGYSSLAYLKRLPLNQLKIDQSFVRDIMVDPNDAIIAKTIVGLAKSFGLGVIAEGVETMAQKDFLAESGCVACQGYLFSRPLSLEDFEQFAAKH